MGEDFRPDCYFCDKKMNKKDRDFTKENNMPNLCKKCDDFLRLIIIRSEAGPC